MVKGIRAKLNKGMGYLQFARNTPFYFCIVWLCTHKLGRVSIKPISKPIIPP